MNVAIMVISREEELYLDEWITYHFNLGVSHIYFLDNNDKGNDNQKNLIEKYGDKITYCDIRGLTYYDLNQNIQMYFYKVFYDKYHSNHDWIMFLDVDEFFTLDSLSLNEFFSQDCYKDTCEIVFNWKCYGDNDLVYYENRPVVERFTKPYDLYACYTPGIIENEFCKCAVNCKYEIIKHDVHSARINGITKNALGKLCPQFGKQNPIVQEVAYIRHYVTKTIDEYVKLRILKKRMHSTCTQDSPQSRIDRFFNVNKHTKEKDDIANFILSKCK